ncbi:hypothetical protein DSL72_006879 [Monilinia vaccinii-corymbosi]|uniref:Uncharacterized protein n=1 Tax=Monilinia vaccinii-corymbosi TaxID=61207 RepID=A0A8A3PK28_9HELO|nr:hypothetical protein DSL72_006879 [Monilinia vaccinii-corymbosi]
MSSQPPFKDSTSSDQNTPNRRKIQSNPFITPPDQTSKPGEITPTPSAPLSRPQLRSDRTHRTYSRASPALRLKHCATCVCKPGRHSTEIDSLQRRIDELEDENEKLRADNLRFLQRQDDDPASKLDVQEQALAQKKQWLLAEIARLEGGGGGVLSGEEDASTRSRDSLMAAAPGQAMQKVGAPPIQQRALPRLDSTQTRTDKEVYQ